MSKKTRVSTPNRGSVQNPDIVTMTTQVDEGKSTLDLSCGGHTTRRGGIGNISGGHATLPSNSMNFSVQKLRVPNHAKHQSMIIPTTDFSGLRQRENSHSNLLVSSIMPGSPLFAKTFLDKNISNLRNSSNMSERDDNMSKDFIEPLGTLFKNSSIRVEDFSKTTRDFRTKSIPNTASYVDLSTLGSRAPSVIGSKRNSFSQAYTQAMKALQDRIKNLEERLRESQMGNEKRMEQGLERENINSKHQNEINQFAKSERLQRDKAELLERQNLELIMKIKTLEEEKSDAMKQIKDLVEEKAQIVEKYQKIIGEKANYQNAYQEIEDGVERMQKELEVALRNEKVLQEKLQQTIVDSAQEKESLRAKNMTLTEALKKLEKDYSECKKVYSERLEDLISKNGALEKELELLKMNYSQQMKDFENELGEIEKAHSNRIAEHENTIAVLRQKLSELENLNHIKQKDHMTGDGNNRVPVNATPADFQNLRKFSLSNVDNSNVQENIRSRSQSPFSPRGSAKDNGLPQNDYMPRINLLIKKDRKANANENNSDMSRNLTIRNGPSPGITGRSEYSGFSDKIIVQQNGTNKNRYRVLDLADLNDKENLDISHQNGILKTPTSKEVQKEFDKYLSPTNAANRILTPTNRDNIFLIDPNQPFILKDLRNGISEPRESAHFQRNLSFGNQELPRDGQAEGGKIDLRNSSIKDASIMLIRKHREDLISSVKGSTRSLSNHASQVLEEKVTAKEREINKLNGEYQDIMKKVQETQDPKERSRMRTELIKITEEIQKLNEGIYQLKKHGTAF